MSLKAKLDEVALSILTKASEDDTPLSVRIEAFKSVGSWYAQSNKTPKKPGEEEDRPAGNFNAIRAMVNGSQTEGTA